MKKKFKSYIDQLPILLNELKSSNPLLRTELAGIPEKGVYVFYENNIPLYVGRSNRLKGRILEHSYDSASNKSAPFAFNLTKEEMVSKKGLGFKITREKLEKAPGFNQAFFEARQRIKSMHIRVVRIDDQILQALFEIYAALELNTKY